MALINILTNTASIEFDGATVNSNAVSTTLALAPTILKSVDKLIAKVGDILTYTIVITNLSLVDIQNLPFTDLLADGIVYVGNSFKLDGSVVTPTISGSTLSYVIANLAALGIANLTFQVQITG